MWWVGWEEERERKGRGGERVQGVGGGRGGCRRELVADEFGDVHDGGECEGVGEGRGGGGKERVGRGVG